MNTIQKEKATTLVKVLESRTDKIQNLLPDGYDATRFAHVALNETTKNPKLLDCDPMSFVGAVYQAGQLGLEIGSSLGLCYIIPYKTQAQFQIGYKGLIQLAYNSGIVTSLMANAVHKNDSFEIQEGTSPKLNHSRVWGDRGELIGFYAVAKLKSGDSIFEMMSVQDVNEVRDKFSRGASRADSPWNTSYEQMGKKTVLKRLFNVLPKSASLNEALINDGKSFQLQDDESLKVIGSDFKMDRVEEASLIEEGLAQIAEQNSEEVSEDGQEQPQS